MQYAINLLYNKLNILHATKFFSFACKKNFVGLNTDIRLIKFLIKQNYLKGEMK
jgi:hypothetical protein